MITTYLCRKKGVLEKNIPMDEIESVLDHRDNLLWIDLFKPTLEEINFLKKTFDFHPLALEDSIHLGQRSKLDEYDGYVFIVLHSIELCSVKELEEAEESENVTFTQVACFVGKNYLVTIHHEPACTIKNTMKRCEDDDRVMRNGVGPLFYNLVDVTVDEYFPILNYFDESIDELEDMIIENPSKKQLNKIFTLKKELVGLRKICGPTREVLNTINDRPLPQFTPESRMYFRDVYDHVIRIYDMIDTYRDLLTNAMEIYLSMVSNRLSEVMKRLAIVATIFMPITFITSFFGMNVKFAYGLLEKETVFWGITVAMAGITMAMLWLFRKARFL
ncbi:MAG: magnesium/cobalt transporter CorA [Firmicutes bacterium]|nr:magnesium/cobalt transporter CorA [Bacillota bacterium]